MCGPTRSGPAVREECQDCSPSGGQRCTAVIMCLRRRTPLTRRPKTRFYRARETKSCVCERAPPTCPWGDPLRYGPDAVVWGFG